eukprot:1629831-Prymnesium_polylepis.1
MRVAREPATSCPSSSPSRCCGGGEDNGEGDGGKRGGEGSEDGDGEGGDGFAAISSSNAAASCCPFWRMAAATLLPSLLTSWQSSCGPSSSTSSQRSASMCPFHAAFITAPWLASLTCDSDKPRCCSQRSASTLPLAAAHCTAAQPKRFIAVTSTAGWSASSSIVRLSPESTAQSNAVESSFMRSVGSAPASSRCDATSNCPDLQAHCSAVRRARLRASIATPTSSSSQRTTSRWPLPAAHISAELPLRSSALRASHPPEDHRRIAPSRSPEAHAFSPPTGISVLCRLLPSRSRMSSAFAATSASLTS